MNGVGIGRTTLIPKTIKILTTATVCAVATVLGVAPPAQAAATTYARPSDATALLTAINQSRAQHSISAVHASASLARAAHTHNLAMANANLLSHQVPGEASLATRIDRVDPAWTLLGENCGYASSDSTSGALLVHQLMMAEGPPPAGQTNHYSTILNGKLHYVGIDVIWDATHHKLWVTEDFTNY